MPFDAAKAKLKKRVRWCKKIPRQHASLTSGGGGIVEAGAEQPPFGDAFYYSRGGQFIKEIVQISYLSAFLLAL
jgi:hypothetical protein